MDAALIKKLDELFTMTDFEGRNIIDEGSITIGYAFEGYGGVDFRVKPAKAALILSRVDDSNNMFRREDVALKEDGRISPVHVTFEPLDPDFYNSYDEDEPVYSRKFVLYFTHINSSSRIQIGEHPLASLTSQFSKPSAEFDDGPTLQQFIEHIGCKKRWSELRFSQMMERRSFGIGIPDLTGDN